MIIVMTGATAGIGAEALKYFTKLSDTIIYVGARGSGRALPEGSEALALDLSSLKSVRSFADTIKQRLGNTKIDVLVLNAGIQAANNHVRSEEGFELTFATNHLSHYLLVRLLEPNLADGGRIIITTSDAHDPAVIPFGPKTLNIDKLRNSTEHSPKGMALYAATKLCNMLTARSLEKEFGAHKNIDVIAFNPGLTGDTSLMGKQPAILKLLIPAIRPLFYLISMFKPAFFIGTAKRSGEALAQLAMGKVVMPAGKIYASLVRGKLTFPEPSKLAQSDLNMDLLWKESAKMVGLPA
ncbi:SDR family NAD(P)-dependent oxidoreductase [Dyadobacter chenhuakuii]|uniref:SDR family NAD(P)-dependent oxidoreductase n=1 Tax=Dyadobacter chenhuakuii TaxID=2909339 RepID=A0A9X1Q7R0_9BACT|nr:SDR family NAD(P)-dependent oxidoreductase [Dyadobacter chenhuakuii]MCF2496710.1 SDR family NAD(P)-dependent oxidoreductase [Dyadobacter chenhuakuii]